MEELTTVIPADGGDTASEQAYPAENDAGEDMTAPSEETAPTDEPTSDTPNPDEMYLPIYNGEVRPVRANDKEEITTLLQLGMKQRDFLPSYERLSRLAAQTGESVKAFIDRLCEDSEQKRLEEAIGEFGEEKGRRYYELDRADRERRYTQLCEQQAATDGSDDHAQRLAMEFVQLREMYPQYSDIRQVPPYVTQSALTNGISLLDAHNRFAIAEQQRQQQSRASSAAAATQSTGSLVSGNGNAKSSVLEAFMEGLHSRV